MIGISAAQCQMANGTIIIVIGRQCHIPTSPVDCNNKLGVVYYYYCISLNVLLKKNKKNRYQSIDN